MLVTVEKRVGILKPQGSLERSRDSAASGTEGSNLEMNSLPSTRKPRQNVAMQAIMRRAETEQKQVTFKNISPVIIEEESARIKPTPTSPNKNGVNKTVQMNMEALGQNGSLNQNQVVSGQTHSIAIPNRGAIVQSGSIPVQNQLKLKLDIPKASQVNQHPQIDPQHNVAQFGFQNQTSYQNQQPFNVQNPQFGKNFMTGYVPNLPQYQIPGQFNVPQNMTMPQGINQTRMPHQRIGNVTQSGTLQKNLPQNSVPQQNIAPNMPHGTALQQTMIQNAGLSQNIGIQQQNIVQNNIRPNLQSQMKIPMSGMTNGVQGSQNLSNYQKNFPQNLPIPNISNASMNPGSLPNVQNINYNPNYGGQNNFNQMYQKQMSPAAFNKAAGQFNFPNPPSTSKGQQSSNNYQRYYDNKDFNLWKDNQPPQPPVTWWGNNGASSIQGKDMQGDMFQNWPTSPPGTGNMFGQVPLTPGNNYHQNSMLGRQPYARNNFDDVRSYEVSNLM